ncbi:hypothetical protein A9Q86_03765 [Flavobacteriales bacterium 33_180_T64]|nr:hypothetical protein A9Q86_03765 [Flavobacteriales bacterium 33_180_T64]
MKKITLSIILLSFAYSSFSQQKKILFVGNSYTAGNNLALLTYHVAESTGNAFIYDSHTPGGQRFLNHAVNITLENKINSENWDFVTLQGQSVEVSLTGPIFDTEVDPFAAQLVDKIKANDACIQPVFFQTWGRENGFPSPGCDDFPWICTYEGMDDALAANYQVLAEQNNSLVSPVGTVWRYLRANFPALDLYASDGSHPSQIGSYAAAVTFYTLFFNNDPTNVTYNYTLSEADANTIKNTVKSVVYDTLNDYDFTGYFTENITDNSVDFSFNNIDADTHIWNFGDESMSVDQSPTHSYTELGDFEVTLTISKCGREHIFTKTISITSLHILDIETTDISVHPNPVTGTLHIDGIKNIDTNITLLNLLGQKIKHFDNSTNSLSLFDVAKGTYFLKISNSSSTKIIKIIKQ